MEKNDITYNLYLDLATYVDPYRVEQSVFLLDEIPEYHPLSLDYREFWKEQRKRCIEGYWYSGVWMPGKLYFYVNFNTIKRNFKGSKVKQFARPLLRDVEWMVYYNVEEARGFSGFEDDPIYSCHNVLLSDLTDDQIKERYCYNEDGFSEQVYNNIFQTSGVRKIYQAPRDYLRKVHDNNYGVALYLNNSKNMLTFGSREFGKAVRKDTSIIHREDGKILLKDLKVGDKIYDDTGQLTTVTNIWEQGKLPLYRVTLADGRYTDACKEHLWEVLEKGKSKVLNTEQLLENYIIKRKVTTKVKSGKEFRYYIKHNKPLQYPEKELSIDPYTLGILIGDGSTTQSIAFTTEDPEIIDYIPYKVNKRSGEYAYGVNGLVHKVHELGLNCKSECKFIPEIYKYGSVDQRLELLKGLMDTDGSIHNKRQVVEYSTSSEQLCKDVVELIRSLGMYCNWTKRKTKRLDNYRVFITPNQQVFKLKRKAKLLTNFSKPRASKAAIVNIELLNGVHEAACISVDNESKLFLVNDFIVTHNSYIAGNITLHEWLFDGLTRYVPANQVNTASDIIMGAFDAKYSGETLDKAKIGLDKLPGGYETYEFKYPAPFTKKYTGSWGPSKNVTAQYKKKVKGTWEDVGTKSIIRHRTFKDNPFAGQGSRNGLIMCEEIGMWPNFLECFAAMVDNQKDGSLKFGSMFMWGTGGSMDQGIVPALDIFYNPQKYDCIVFEDIWENKGEICFFMPAYLALNNTKDTSGKTLMGLALSEIHNERDKLAGNKGSKDRLQREMQYRPIKPSEMFLTKTGNYFPIVEMKERLALLDSKVKPEDWQKKVQLYFDPNAKGGVRYEIDTTNSLNAIDKYPWHGPSKEGCVVIYEFPITDKAGVVPKDLYLIGHDPIATDSVTGESFAATYVIKTKKYWNTYGHDEIVAAYVSRPYDGRGPINENLLKLSMLYGNALIYFENMVGNVKEYFEKMKRLDLLARQPTTVFNKKASFDGKGQAVVYGYPMSNRKIKMDAVQYVRDWLLEERGQEDGRIVRNLDRIWDKALLQELIAFDLDGNYDRCVEENTIVTAEKGLIPIKDIQVGDKVLTHKGYYEKVLKKYNRIEKDMVEVSVYGNTLQTLKCSIDHPILVARNKKRGGNRHFVFDVQSEYVAAENLKSQTDYVFIPKRMYGGGSGRNSELDYLLGWYLGDGNVHKNRVKFIVAKGQEESLHKLEDILNKYQFSKDEEVRPRIKQGATIKEYNNYYALTIYSENLSKYLINKGGTAHNKLIDYAHYNSQNLYYTAIGFLEAEGHFKQKKRVSIECATTSIPLMHQMRQILIDNGIWSSISKVGKRGSFKEQARITISGRYVCEILRVVPFWNLEKQISRSREFAIETHFGFFTPVKEVKKTKFAKVQNLHVNKDHTYVTEGFVTHNCMALMGCIIGMNETHNQYQNSIEAAARDYNSNSLSFLLSNRLIGGDNYQETKTKLKTASIDFSSLKF